MALGSTPLKLQLGSSPSTYQSRNTFREVLWLRRCKRIQNIYLLNEQSRVLCVSSVMEYEYLHEVAFLSGVCRREAGGCRHLLAQSSSLIFTTSLERPRGLITWHLLCFVFPWKGEGVCLFPFSSTCQIVLEQRSQNFFVSKPWLVPTSGNLASVGLLPSTLSEGGNFPSSAIGVGWFVFRQSSPAPCKIRGWTRCVLMLVFSVQGIDQSPLDPMPLGVTPGTPSHTEPFFLRAPVWHFLNLDDLEWRMIYAINCECFSKAWRLFKVFPWPFRKYLLWCTLSFVFFSSVPNAGCLLLPELDVH